MTIEQIYTGCLAQGAYYIESEGEAAVIDPLRDYQNYVTRAAAGKAKLRYIFETHFHADFVSGHLDLAEATGAKIIYGPGAKTTYDKHEAQDGERFQLGKVSIEVLHTPGHTMESSCYLLRDEGGKAHALFTGDTLFIGDVGRPDLSQPNSGITQEMQAGMLYDSLRAKIMPLPDDVIIYPAHGAGSACGKKMSRETQDTLGSQKASNYALRADMTREEFIEEVTEGLLPPPAYFSENARLNQEGYGSIETALNQGLVALNPEQFEHIANREHALILDVRDKAAFVKGFIPNSIFIGLDGSFAPWVGAMIPDLKQPILLVVPPGREEEAVTRLARVGFDNVLGYLDLSSDLHPWTSSGRELDQLDTIDATALQQRDLETEQAIMLDLRKPGEWNGGHLSYAINRPLNFLNESMRELDAHQTYYLHCGSGYRSTIAGSILKSRGFEKLINVQDKVADILATEAAETA
ncbi:MAG: MBL fold metallo-hydrolase [Bacteroidota bacterium]